MGRQWSGGVAVLGGFGGSDRDPLRDRGGGWRSALIGWVLSILRVNMEL